MKKILTIEERKKWQVILTKYFQQVNKTGGSHLSTEMFEAVDRWYQTYLQSEQMKKNIVEKTNDKI